MVNMCKIYSLWLFVLSILFLFLVNFYMMSDLSVLIGFSIFSLGPVKFNFCILLDWMSFMFMSFVCLITSVVLFYSDEYMSGEIFKDRFVHLIIMFVMSMMFLILSPNLLSILLGWDGLGLVSYCLVIFYQNWKSFNAGMLTALSNRIGDVALLMAIAWMVNFGSWNFVFYLDYFKNTFIMQLILCFVISAAITKSAQIPFSSWLPAAMAAPTPVSALVHSSTLVTAGVYLLIRFNFAFFDEVSLFLLYLSLLTMFMSGLSANFEYDLKKIIALSTLSQLGLMMSILSLGSYDLAFLHLLIHALFKALLFLCAGMIIHNFSNCQDIRFMGGMMSQMPLTCTYFNICNFSLCGLPFFSGFYSKDMIAEVMSLSYANLFVYLIFYISIGLTVSYSIRLFFYSLSGDFNHFSFNSCQEFFLSMSQGMSAMIMFVIFSGTGLVWLLFPSPYFICLSQFMKMLVIFCVVMGAWIGYETSKFKYFYVLKSFNFMSLSKFNFLMWNLSILSPLGVNFIFLNLGKIYLKLFDQGWFEYYGKTGIFNALMVEMKFLQFLSVNYLKVYFILIIFWTMILLGFSLM
uniref:NADH-ubiquinone oxidoreductase chain 5 n=1 Tax=Urodontus sp. URO01 TaxID=1205589 RepID=A0A0S2MPC0_9CUCU|nr:NADH deshydrogenase subunit 5 [Urodontus sp. URO01]